MQAKRDKFQTFFASVFFYIFICWFTFPSFECLSKTDILKDLPSCSQNPSTMHQRNISLLQHLIRNVQRGGYHKPKNCTSKDKVAIIIPFRDRITHLDDFIGKIHKFLIKQQLEYQIFVVEQNDEEPFNRGALLNVGFLEALKLVNWDCVIFHDVDLIPLDGRNIYDCPDQPRHMSAAIDVYNYELPYKLIFGGVSAIRSEQFQQLNGFSNSFWGWGGEDDDLSFRVREAGLLITRYPLEVARYKMLPHQKSKPNPSRFALLKAGEKTHTEDGLNSIQYEVIKQFEFPLYSWFYVNLTLLKF